jgi:hypothetical protein
VRSGSTQGRPGQTAPAGPRHAGEVTTTTARPGLATTTRRPQAVPTQERRTARVAGVALAALTVLSVPATALLDTADRPATRTLVGAAFVAVAALEVVVGWGLYALLRDRAHSPAYAALVSRGGYAVLLTAAAGRLLWPGGDGVAGFRSDWSLALVVLGVHLLVTSIALWCAHRVPGAVVAGTVLAGTASLLAAVGGGLPLPDVLPGAGALLPAVLGEVVLLAWLVMVGWDDDVR